jgi:hypothetical protein
MGYCCADAAVTASWEVGRAHPPNSQRARLNSGRDRSCRGRAAPRRCSWPVPRSVQ